MPGFCCSKREPIHYALEYTIRKGKGWHKHYTKYLTNVTDM